jgi:hypothetical protein
VKFYALHNGKRIPYWLGLLIGLDQFVGVLVPGADVDKTISHRLGMRRLKIALRRGVVTEAEVMTPLTKTPLPFKHLHWEVRARLIDVRIPFLRYPLAAAVDALLERIDPGHSLKAIGA